ncbi:methyl-accepting chemotaxis protein [Myxococcus stipitatus]|uniref:methyl-accepting chemotaxis protein n=1 Tax=Myxococcus stipitatus TaxID=83455 RepID=UPI001F1DA4F7|nr:methyl-accepting chemotaxis protein [Myxococcus stipitatus]MCE9671091.1 methyl-accepting chemotaxis protein [Myxococcus stipitatus]
MHISVDATALARRAQDIFDAHQLALTRRTDRMFALLLGLQWGAGLALALWLSPRTWVGTSSAIHPHVWAAGLLGFVLSSLPVALGLLRSGLASTRFVIAVAQALWSALLIHLTDGRIETHFHIFGSMAFLAVYRDVRVVGVYSAVVVADHLLRGVFWPQSIFGTDVGSLPRALEHGGWVLFEVVFLVITCRGGLRDLKELSFRQARLELAQGEVRARVVEPLVDSARDLTVAMRSLSESTEEQRSTLARQAQALSETQATATELQRASADAARQADAILAAATRAGDMGASVQESLGRSMAGLEGIREQVAQFATHLEGLAERARRLTDVASTIKDLSDQSNMVAVNAAIEAARSGEQGRGFAVVALEMRRLARQSQQAMTEVRGILDDTRRAIQDAVGLSQRGAERMAHDLDVVRASGEDLRGLSSIVDRGADSIRRISATVGQQAAGVTQLFAAVNDLSSMMSESLGRLEATRIATGSLQGVTDRVHGVIQTYRPDERNPS